MDILDRFWLVRFTKVRVETKIEAFWRLDPCIRLWWPGSNPSTCSKAILASAALLAQLGHQLVFSRGEGESYCIQTSFPWPQAANHAAPDQPYVYKMQQRSLILITSLLGWYKCFLIWLLFPPESGCLTHTPSSLQSRRRSSVTLLKGSSLPARESSPQMNPPVKTLMSV